MSNTAFHVLDAKSGEDITRNILMQIILRREAGGQPIFSKQSLLQMIRFYGNSLQGMMAPFLEQNLNQFLELQTQYLAHCQKIGGLVSPETWSSFVNKSKTLLITLNP
jgi:polyhydroxyalkanoate synthesis repressor PhaR